MIILQLITNAGTCESKESGLEVSNDRIYYGKPI